VHYVTSLTVCEFDFVAKDASTAATATTTGTATTSSAGGDSKDSKAGDSKSSGTATAAAATAAGPTAAEKELEASKSMKVGDRCETSTSARGSVQYIGTVEGYDSNAALCGAAGPGATWIGVKLDEPLGNTDGTVKGKKYFTAKPKFGIFVRPTTLKVGDYPEEDLDEEL
jgi:hypothetical protein